MGRRILYIILGALIILGLILALWFWFFNRPGSTASNSNLFGSGQDRGGSGADNGTGGNGQAPIGSNTGANTGAGGNGGGGTDIGNNIETPINQGDTGVGFDAGGFFATTSSGASWSLPSGGGSSSWIVFNPTPINSLNDTSVFGQPYITKVTGADGKQVSLLSGLGVLIGGCIVQYGLNWLAVQGSSAFAKNALAFFFVQTNSPIGNTSEDTNTITECLVRTLGKLAVQQITDSTVNWINSGFDGKPAFVQDFNKFFADVTDQAAGSFIQNETNFAFLCSPFQLQVRIAIAQSYARRSNAPSCTLSDVVGNVDGFFNGNGFSQGGWGGLIAFTTQPSNNPFGAFQILQGGLDNAISTDVQNKTLEVNLGQGFLSVRDKDGNITTPGSAVEAQLQASINADISSLQLGNSIDQILTALQSALVNKLMSGLTSKASASNGSNVDTKGQSQADTLMGQLQGGVQYAQQYATVEQRIITDIQTAQQSLTTLQNCWAQATSSPNLTPAQVTQANNGAADAASKLAQLEGQVGLYNAKITDANGSITALQELQTDLLMASVAADVTRVQTRLNAIMSSGNPEIFTAADVTTAQQDRDSNQSDLSVLSTQTSAQLQQCYAFGS